MTEASHTSTQYEQELARAHSIFSLTRLAPVLPVELHPMAGLVRDMLGRALHAVEWRELDGVADLLRRDVAVDDTFCAVLRQLISYMFGDPRTISASLEVLFVAKALERVGDHAKNVSEHAIYAAKGMELRHATIVDVERQLGAHT